MYFFLSPSHTHCLFPPLRHLLCRGHTGGFFVAFPRPHTANGTLYLWGGLPDCSIRVPTPHLLADQQDTVFRQVSCAGPNVVVLSQQGEIWHFSMDKFLSRRQQQQEADSGQSSGGGPPLHLVRARKVEVRLDQEIRSVHAGHQRFMAISSCVAPVPPCCTSPPCRNPGGDVHPS